MDGFTRAHALSIPLILELIFLFASSSLTSQLQEDRKAPHCAH